MYLYIFTLWRPKVQRLVYTYLVLRLHFGACNTPLERLFQDLSNGMSKAPKFLKLQLVNNKKNSHLVSADQGGQINRNKQTIVILFYHVFY